MIVARSGFYFHASSHSTSVGVSFVEIVNVSCENETNQMHIQLCQIEHEGKDWLKVVFSFNWKR